jgi:hypothetical protein
VLDAVDGGAFSSRKSARQEPSWAVMRATLGVQVWVLGMVGDIHLIAACAYLAGASWFS